MKKRLLISFSGGRTSAYMAQWLLKHKQEEYEMVCVFANTGRERIATLKFVEECNRFFGLDLVTIEAEVNPEKGKGTGFRFVSFAEGTASVDGEPFEAMIRKYGIPNKAFPHCTRELKLQPIRAFARSIGWDDYYTAIGIRADEIDRVSAAAKENKIIYPLISMRPTSKKDVNLFWSEQPFDLELKSYEGNCDLCWKKSDRKLLTLISEVPDIAYWWRQMEKKYGGDNQFTFFRNNRSALDLIELAKHPFRPARDESKDIEHQLSIFDYSDLDALNKWADAYQKDFEEEGYNSCEESCEVF